LVGDILILHPGLEVPVDGMVINASKNLFIDESCLNLEGIEFVIYNIKILNLNYIK